MIVRRAEAGDAPAIAEIWNGYIRDTAVTFNSQEKTVEGLVQEIAARRSEGMSFLVAEHEGQVIGFATAFPFRSGPGYRHTLEHTVQLSEPAHGQGAGRALMARVEAEARAGGAHVLVAGVSSENPDGIAFHEALGFETVGRMPEVGFKFGRWMDLVLMQKVLSAP